MGDLSDFQRRQIVGERLAGASITKMTTLLGVSRTAFSNKMVQDSTVETQLVVFRLYYPVPCYCI